MANSEKYYGWSDVSDLQEAIIFYAEMFSRGYHHHEICSILDNYFPQVDFITLSKIRTKAFIWLQNLATNIEIKIYLAKSIVRLERICANKKANIKYVLAADSQLTHLLGLANIQEKSGPEELAELMRAFNKASREATDGTAYTKEQEVKESPEVEKFTEPQQPKQPSQTKPLDEFDLSDDEKKINETLVKARAVRLQIEIETMDKEVKQREQSKQKQQGREAEQDLIDFAANN